VTQRGSTANQMGDLLLPVDLGTGGTASAVSVGQYHSCAILTGGTVKCWGLNDKGQLGKGDVVTRGDNAGEMGDSLSTIDLGTGHTVKAMASGSNHSCAVLDTDQVKCWGDNANGQLGLGDNLARGDAAGEMGEALPHINIGADSATTI
jgi:alpha-tubulin suppressor-like RCC1 family protein